MGIASAELDVSADVNTNSMNAFDTPSRKREEFRLCLSPSPTKCNHGEQLMRVESKLDMVLQILQAKPENTSQEVHMYLCFKSQLHRCSLQCCHHHSYLAHLISMLLLLSHPLFHLSSAVNSLTQIHSWTIFVVYCLRTLIPPILFNSMQLATQCHTVRK